MASADGSIGNDIDGESDGTFRDPKMTPPERILSPSSSTLPDSASSSSAIVNEDPAATKQTLPYRRNYTAPPVPHPYFMPPVSAKALPEDEYNLALEHIIQRDFYPDLPRLRLLHRIAGTSDPLQRATLYRAYEALTPITTIGTPCGASDGASFTPTSQPCAAAQRLPLDAFQRLYNSEDSAGFAELLREDAELRRAREHWIEGQMETHNKRRQVLVEAVNAGENVEAIIFPHFDARNALMFPPPAAAIVPSADGEAADGGVNPRRTAPRNTRLPTHLQDSCRAAEAQMARHSRNSGAATRRDLMDSMLSSGDFQNRGWPTAEGSGATSLAEQLGLSGTADDYALVRTPQLVPGDAGCSPQMTWGQIAATPIALGSIDEPLKNENEGRERQFLIQEPSARDGVGHELGERAARSHGVQKRKRQRHLQRLRVSTPASSVLGTPMSVGALTPASGVFVPSSSAPGPGAPEAYCARRRLELLLAKATPTGTPARTRRRTAT
eukprot:Polyplicarium_translucidae@DN1559_c0_g2_i1.p1